ncbi:MAG: flavin reductase (DIM6/NTAB) family NADH-FMN oxidoreductase RutF [Candidatus Endobugula sp.]|jgi:flavin reductase (DIM6/NTAB) family NADH-FMN oxidoreductase RutF
MIIDFTQQQPSNRYHIMTQTIIPRPIAWVLSENSAKSIISEGQRYNLAPFSFFNAVCSDPPILMLSIGKKSDNSPKDTRENLLSGRDFVIHIANVLKVDALSQSSAESAYGESEVSASQLALVDFPNSPVPRLQSCSVAYHCKLYDSHTLGPNQQAIIYAEICHLYIDDIIVQEKNNRFIIDAQAINPLVRLGANQYASMGEPFSLKRP